MKCEFFNAGSAGRDWSKLKVEKRVDHFVVFTIIKNHATSFDVQLNPEQIDKLFEILLYNAKIDPWWRCSE